MFIYKTKIHLHDTDAAGLLFFSNQLKIVHDAYESALDQAGFGFDVLLRRKKYFLPIVHAEAGYKAPLFVGDRITVEMTVERLGTTSFTFVYKIFNQKKTLVGTARTVHVTTDKKTRKKIPLPSELRKAVKTLL
ncbi:MAG: thioesterase family protein [Candidatus Omnitrophota bacterium]|nr:thioesterase family protein [Candidatus Omnitrophota bacterium]